MKSMKSAMKSGGLTQSAVYSSVADHWLEAKAGERRGGRHHGSGLGAAQEERHVQVRGHAQHEVEEEAGNRSPQGRQPFHQGAMRLQSKTRLQDRACVGHEEAEG